MTHWLSIAALSLLAFWLRVVPRFAQVFGTGEFVNFTETDAWWHVRVMEHMARNFPFRLKVDAFGRIDGGQSVDTGVFFDLLPAFLGWTFGLSSHSMQQLAAWYPAILGVLLVPVTFLCGRAIFSPAAGLWAAAVVATLPGHFLHTGSLGFTDHHVMETLLTSILLYLLASEASAVLLGLTLTTYLLTFPGGAFVVALVTIWYWFEGLRTRETESRPFAYACLMAAPFALWQVHVYLMRYSLAAVLLAAAALWLLPFFSRWCHRQAYPRATYLGISAMIVATTLAGLSLTMPGEESFLRVLSRLTASNPLAVTVNELQSLTNFKGFFSLEQPWHQFGGAFVFTLMALPLLAESIWRKPDRRLSLMFLWALGFFIMAMTQARMTYYFGVSAALLSGYLMSQLRWRSWAALALAAFLIAPNLRQTLTDDAPLPGQVTPDWRAALGYLHDHTPSPFADPRAFDRTPTGKPSYSVLAWWDYGYWITTVAHRVPVTNPTQNNARAAADFLLATDEAAAQRALKQAQSRYVVLDSRLLLLSDEISIHGIFLSLFPYSRNYRLSDYAHDTEDASGRRLFFRAKYFETMLVRLFLADGQFNAAPRQGNFAVIEVQGKNLLRSKQYNRLDEAQNAAAACPQCELVSENPITPCVDLAAVKGLDPVFASPTVAVRFEGRPRATVQIFAVR